jgi:hypothetical protein
MPLQSRTIAVKAAVVFFFVFSTFGLLSGLCAYICCKRALAAAFVAYMLSSALVWIVNIMIREALISELVKKYLNERNNR